MGVKQEMKLKKTTLLVIGAILLWGVVAIWNGIQRENTGSSPNKGTTPATETVNKQNQGIISPTGRVNIATH
jgi:uncharacterized membrane protein